MRRAVVLAFLLLLVGSPASAADPQRKALEAFVAGRYQEALGMYAKLYADTLHPVYLRNIGRCHQKLRDPDRAIEAFGEYLRKAKDVAPDERREIEGFVREMEVLRDEKRAQAASPVAPDAPDEAPKTTPARAVPTRLDVAAIAVPPAPILVGEGSPKLPGQADPPVYRRWWFWAAIGGVVVVSASVFGASRAGLFTSQRDAACEPGYRCQ